MPSPTPARGPSDVAGLIARLERTALGVGLACAVVSGVMFGWRAAAGVVGGGLLSAISYRALARAVAALGPPPPGEEGRARISPARVALGLITRHALLLGAGYVIIARLHLHPLWVLAGSSAVVIAASVEAVRSWR
jgi:hypothetical protein